jgi:hypothetical protein
MAVPPPGRLRLFWPLTPEFPAGPGSPRLTNDQGRTAQNVPVCVAYMASHDVGKAARNGGCARNSNLAGSHATWSGSR